MRTRHLLAVFAVVCLAGCAARPPIANRALDGFTWRRWSWPSVRLHLRSDGTYTWETVERLKRGDRVTPGGSGEWEVLSAEQQIVRLDGGQTLKLYHDSHGVPRRFRYRPVRLRRSDDVPEEERGEWVRVVGPWYADRAGAAEIAEIPMGWEVAYLLRAPE